MSNFDNFVGPLNNWQSFGRLAIVSLCLLTALGCTTTGNYSSKICADYLSRRACTGLPYHAVVNGKDYYTHLGIDFRSSIGVPVISASNGRISSIFPNHECGGGLYVSSSLVKNSDATGTLEHLYVQYWHIVIDEGIHPGMDVKIGDRLGTIADPKLARNQRCVMRDVPHLHFSVLKDEFDDYSLVNPHEYWIDGDGIVSCNSGGFYSSGNKLVVPFSC